MKAFILFLLLPTVAGMLTCHTCADEFFLTTNDIEIREFLDSNPPIDWMPQMDWNRVPFCNDNGTFFLNDCPGHCLKYDFFDNETFVGSFRMCEKNNSIVPFNHTQYVVEYEPCYLAPCFLDESRYPANVPIPLNWFESHFHHIYIGVTATLWLTAICVAGYLCFKPISHRIKSRRERDERDAFLEEARRRDFHARESIQMTENVPSPMDVQNSVAYKKPESVSEYEEADEVYEEVGQGPILN